MVPAPHHGVLQLANQIQAGLQGLRAGLPLGGAHLVAVLVDELAGLQLAEQLVGVAAHVAGADLVGNDTALGIHDEAAALGQTIGLDQDLKVLCQSMSWVCSGAGANTGRSG